MNDRNILPPPPLPPKKKVTYMCYINSFFLLSINLCVVSSFRRIVKPITIVLLINGLAQNVNAIYVLI